MIPLCKTIFLITASKSPEISLALILQFMNLYFPLCWPCFLFNNNDLTLSGEQLSFLIHALQWVVWKLKGSGTFGDC